MSDQEYRELAEWFDAKQRYREYRALPWWRRMWRRRPPLP